MGLWDGQYYEQDFPSVDMQVDTVSAKEKNMYELINEGELVLSTDSLDDIQEYLRERLSDAICDDKHDAERWPQDFVDYDFEASAREYIADTYSVRQVVELPEY